MEQQTGPTLVWSTITNNKFQVSCRAKLAGTNLLQNHGAKYVKTNHFSEGVKDEKCPVQVPPVELLLGLGVLAGNFC